MPQGLQIWDASGNLILDTTSNVGRVIGSQVLAGGATGSITPTKLANERLWMTFAAIDSTVFPAHKIWRDVAASPSSLDDPDGDRIRWQINAASGGRLIYGVW